LKFCDNTGLTLAVTTVPTPGQLVKEVPETDGVAGKLFTTIVGV